MTESEKNQIVQEITQNVLTALADNSIDWSTSKISFSDIESITTAIREKVLIPAIDTRENKRVYGNLDLNTLLSAYGLKEVKTLADSVTDASESAINDISDLATNKKNELNSIVATGISKIEQTSTSTESGGSNILTITQTNGTPTQFIVRNGSKGGDGARGETGSTGNGISSIAVSESTADGGNNVVTINMTDGTSKTFNVKNGSKGADGSSGGGSSEVSSKLIVGSENSTGGGGYDTNSDADLNAFIETGMVKWAKYRNISGLPNADGMVQSIGWRSPTDGAGWGRQIAYDDESNNIYSRYMGNGSWSAWTKVLVAGDSAPASDVYSWAKASTKPTYTASEVGASASGHSHSEYKVVTNYAHGTTGTKTLSAIAVNQMGFFSYRFDGSGGSVKLPSGGTYLAMTFYNQGDESNHVTFSKSSYVSLSGGATIASINPDNDLNSSYAYCYGIYIRKS